MRKSRIYLLLFLFLPVMLGIYCATSIWADEEPREIEITILQPHEYPIITVSGRLLLKKPADKERLLLHSKDATAYSIKGELVEELKSLLLDLGEKHIISVTGNQDGAYSTSCHNSYGFDAASNRTIDSQCVRYYNLEVTKIIDAKRSDEEIPPPKRDSEEEEKARATALYQDQTLTASLTPKVMGEIQGRINSLNLKSPVKTIEITNRDKDSQLTKLTLFLTNNTRVAKTTKDKEPMYLSTSALREEQEVTAVYIRDELKSEALFITITKE